MIPTLKKAFVDSTPVFFAFIFLGIGYGMLMEQNGFGYLWTFFISLFTFAGSAQFAMISFLTESLNPIYVFMLVLVINARHIFYGISMAKKYETTGMKKYYLYFGLTDETFTVLNAHEDDIIHDKPKYYLLVTIFHHLYWVLGSLLGAILGRILPFEILGLEFILFALFLSVYVSQMKKAKDKYPGLFGICLSLIALLLFETQFVVASMIFIIIALVLYEKKYTKKVNV